MANLNGTARNLRHMKKCSRNTRKSLFSDNVHDGWHLRYAFVLGLWFAPTCVERGRRLLPRGSSEHSRRKQASPGCNDEQARHSTETAGRRRNRPAGPRRSGGDVLGTKGKLQRLLLCGKSRSWLGARAHHKTERVMAALFTNLFTAALSSLAAQSLHCLKRWI